MSGYQIEDMWMTLELPAYHMKRGYVGNGNSRDRPAKKLRLQPVHLYATLEMYYQITGEAKTGDCRRPQWI